jgi:hypothetical protein
MKNGLAVQEMKVKHFMVSLTLAITASACNGVSSQAPVDAGSAATGTADSGSHAVALWGGENDEPTDDARIVYVPPKPDPRTAAQIAAAACVNPSGEWRCKTPKPKTFAAAGSTPITPVSWTVPNWYFAPGSGADDNTCTTSGSPCATWGEIWVHRLGAGSPQLQQNTTFHQLSGQTLNVDNIFGTFQLSAGHQVAFIGSLTQVCTIPINTATVTAQVRGGPGTRWQVSNMCGGAAGKMLLQDVTQNTWSTIDSIGGGVATISQPLSNSLLTTIGSPTLAEASMATNDAFAVWSQPLSNLKRFQVVSTDTTSSGVAGVAWIQDVEVADSSTTGVSSFAIPNDSPAVFSRVRFDGRIRGGSAHTYYLLGGDVAGDVRVTGGFPILYGGVLRSSLTSIGSAPQLLGDVAVHGNFFLYASTVILGTSGADGVYSDASMTVEESTTTRITGPLWGTVAIGTAPNGWVRCNSTPCTAVIVTNGTLQVTSPTGNATTGSFYSAGTWTDGTTITATNIHAHGGLQNPITHCGYSED